MGNDEVLVDGRLPAGARRRSERGASAVEYGLLIAGIAAVIVLAVLAFGGGVDGLFKDSCESLKAAIGSCENPDDGGGP